jgi:hypothetical protein
MDPDDFDHSLLGRHSYACALTTRGGICDCMPADPVASAGSDLEAPGADRAAITSTAEVRSGRTLYPRP